MAMKTTMHNRRYIFKWLFFHCNVSFREGTWMGVSKNSGKTPQIIHLFIGFGTMIFSPSILGAHPYVGNLALSPWPSLVVPPKTNGWTHLEFLDRLRHTATEGADHLRRLNPSLSTKLWGKYVENTMEKRWVFFKKHTAWSCSIFFLENCRHCRLLDSHRKLWGRDGRVVVVKTLQVW